jgi:hypothetical protein
LIFEQKAEMVLAQIEIVNCWPFLNSGISESLGESAIHEIPHPSGSQGELRHHRKNSEFVCFKRA